MPAETLAPGRSRVAAASHQKRPRQDREIERVRQAAKASRREGHLDAAVGAALQNAVAAHDERAGRRRAAPGSRPPERERDAASGVIRRRPGK
jgi:hypothetical protein